MLQVYRQQLDLLNTQLLRVLELRGSVVLSVLELKRNHQLPIHDPLREAAMLAALCRQTAGPYSTDQIERIFSGIFAASRALTAPGSDAREPSSTKIGC